jgi:putative serine protease PepD
MNTLTKVAVLTSVTTAALVYVLLEWRPLRTEGARSPEVTWAEPGIVAAEPAAPKPPAADFSEDEQNNIDIYRRYSAGVVNITSKALAYNARFQVVPVEAGTGSGVILDDKGNIATNHHVIEPSLGQNGGGLEVTLADNTKYDAKVVGTDISNDLAVIRIDAPKDKLSWIPIGKSSDLVVGQKVLAIGNPFGLERTMTTGIISALGRSIQAENRRIIENIIQTDAAINPGNSGGPLLNSQGEIIGINAQIASPTDASAGIGFAIPADTVKRVVNDLITYGFVRRPYAGIRHIEPLTRYPVGLLQRLGIPTNRGFMVIEVDRTSPAARAGIRGVSRQVQYRLGIYPVGGDILLEFQGKEISSAVDIANEIDHLKPGVRVTFTILRDGQKMDVPVVLGETTAETQ